MKFSVTFLIFSLIRCSVNGAGDRDVIEAVEMDTMPETVSFDKACLFPEFDKEKGVLTIFDTEGKRLLRTYVSTADAAYGLFSCGHSDVESNFLMGFISFSEENAFWNGFEEVSSVEAGYTAVQFTLKTGCGIVVGTIIPVDQGVIKIEIQANEEMNRTAMTFECPEDERFFGFGAQTYGVEHRGETIPIWVSEQGVGKDYNLDESEISAFGHKYDSYYPVPFYISNKGYGLWLDTFARSKFELCSKKADALRVEAWENGFRAYIITGANPFEIIERFTKLTGRAEMPVKWTFAPWLAMQTGSGAVRVFAKFVREKKIPATALWVQDWIGGFEQPAGYELDYHWEADEALYPDLKELTNELRSNGFRFLGYFNPFITAGHKEFEEASEKGYLAKDPDGADYIFDIMFKKGGVLDVSNPEAVEWAKGYMKKAIELGLDGWMADFGEWVPFDMRFHNGETGETFSSRYPLFWQKLNRDLFDEMKPEGDYLFFVRSGFTGAVKHGNVIWAGDQNTDFGEDDGLPTVIPIGVNLGISGVGIFGHDIAGFSSIFTTPSTKELYFRWTALGAFSPVMRTHEGMDRKKNWQFDKDDETVAHFGRYARIHARLFPLLYGLAKEYAATGHPIMRHPFLHYPGAVNLYHRKDQYMLGDSLLIAPVVKEGEKEKSLYLPPGDWYELLNGKKYTGKKDIEVPADFTEIPVFARAGAVIPLLNDAPDTFAGGDSGVIVTLDQVLEKGLTILVFRGGGGSFTLEDGVEISQKFTALCEPVLFELTETYDKDQQGSGGAKMIHEEIKEFKVEDDFYGGFDYELKVTGGGDFSIAGYNGENAECVNIRVKGSVKKRDFRFLVWNP